MEEEEGEEYQYGNVMGCAATLSKRSADTKETMCDCADGMLRSFEHAASAAAIRIFGGVQLGGRCL